MLPHSSPLPKNWRFLHTRFPSSVVALSFLFVASGRGDEEEEEEEAACGAEDSPKVTGRPRSAPAPGGAAGSPGVNSADSSGGSTLLSLLRFGALGVLFYSIFNGL